MAKSRPGRDGLGSALGQPLNTAGRGCLTLFPTQPPSPGSLPAGGGECLKLAMEAGGIVTFPSETIFFHL